MELEQSKQAVQHPDRASVEGDLRNLMAELNGIRKLVGERLSPYTVPMPEADGPATTLRPVRSEMESVVAECRDILGTIETALRAANL